MHLEANIALLYKKRRNSNTATSIYFFGQMMTTPDTYFLKSRRLGFRTWKKDDLDLALGLWGDHEVTKLFDARGALSKNQVKERLGTFQIANLLGKYSSLTEEAEVNMSGQSMDSESSDDDDLLLPDEEEGEELSL